MGRSGPESRGHRLGLAQGLCFGCQARSVRDRAKRDGDCGGFAVSAVHCELSAYVWLAAEHLFAVAAHDVATEQETDHVALAATGHFDGEALDVHRPEIPEGLQQIGVGGE